jgi:DUF4097 and DUF4098 domain-containing protein YvlB
MKTRALFAAVLFAYAGFLSAEVRRTMRYEQKFAMNPDGTFVLENPVGNVEITGADVSAVEATILTTIIAQSEAVYQEAKSHSGFAVGGDGARTAAVRMAVDPTQQKKPWSMIVHWTVRVPRSASVRVVSNSSDRIRVANLLGAVRINNFNGNVVVENVFGSIFVESVNGSIVYASEQPNGNVVLSTLNGHVTATVPPDADFRWIAETATGDIRTNLPARGAFYGATFRGSVNAPGGPTITTTSLMGNIHLLAAGAAPNSMVSVRSMPATVIAPPEVHGSNVKMQVTPSMTSGGPRELRRGTVNGLFTYSTNLGDVKVREIRGSTEIFTGAGQVQIGTVNGSAKVRSDGGPMQFGEIFGVLNAITRVGDILVDSTRRGGTIETQGGTIRLLYTGGPTRLTSGGGDITVRQAAAPITAETTSGDIAITLDAKLPTQKVDARTNKGNVILTVSSKFRGDIDATITTSNPNADTFVSDIPGLSISREQIAGKTRVRATGKINGGGEKVVLQATDGDIRITTGNVAPTLVKRK